MTEEGSNSRGQLRSLVERIERLEEDRKAIGHDIKEVYLEGKSGGFDTKALRQIIRIRAEDPSKRAEREAILETYMTTLGMT